MNLTDLIGEHELTGVDFGELPPDRDNYRYESANTITFVLDGHAYCAMEDPSDGYRSSMRDIVEVPNTVKNTFTPCRVLAQHRTKCDYGHSSDVLECLDIVTGKVVLEVGTENDDDYYPSYVANFTPEHMAVNQSPAADLAGLCPQCGKPYPCQAQP